MKTQTKITLIFFLSAVLIVGLLGLGVYFFNTRYSYDDFYKRLEIRGVITARAELDHEEVSASVMREVREMHLEKLPEEKEYFIELQDNRVRDEDAAKLNLPHSFFEDIVNTGVATYQDGELFSAGILYEGKFAKYAVVVTAANYYYSHHLNYLRNILLVGVAVASMLSFAIAKLLSRQVFRPVKEISNRVERISSSNLNLRLEKRHTSDEISVLERTFNNMLDRLETAFETQNNFISNASHELRTPLTSIIGETEVALSKQRTAEEYRESLESVLQQAERLEKITHSLLFLAQTGFKKNLQPEKVRTDQLLWDVKATIERINPKSQIQINLSLFPDNPEKFNILGNEQLLHLAISNIVSNACKYSDNQPVFVSAGTTEQKVVIVIKDTGIGIPANDLKYIYDPFFRASNVKGYEGYGIGLPLTNNIVRMHGGEISVLSSLGEGTTVQLSFPAASQA